MCIDFPGAVEDDKTSLPALWKEGHTGCSMACSHKRSEGNHLSQPLQQEWKQAGCSSLPFSVEITSSGKMETLTFHHLSANAYKNRL